MVAIGYGLKEKGSKVNRTRNTKPGAGKPDGGEVRGYQEDEDGFGRYLVHWYMSAEVKQWS